MYVSLPTMSSKTTQSRPAPRAASSPSGGDVQVAAGSCWSGQAFVHVAGKSTRFIGFF